MFTADVNSLFYNCNAIFDQMRKAKKNDFIPDFKTLRHRAKYDTEL